VSDYDDSGRSNLPVDALPVPVEAAITSRTRAVIAVHVARHPADMDRLTDICAPRSRADRRLRPRLTAHGQMVGTFGVRPATRSRRRN